MYNDKIEGYLHVLGLEYELLNDGVWLVNDPERGLPHVVLFVDAGKLTIRTKVMDVPEDGLNELYEDLLRYNNTMVHGSYALDEDGIIILDTLEAGTLDLDEIQASLDAIGLALVQHYPRLSRYITQTSE